MAQQLTTEQRLAKLLDIHFDVTAIIAPLSKMISTSRDNIVALTKQDEALKAEKSPKETFAQIANTCDALQLAIAQLKNLNVNKTLVDAYETTLAYLQENHKKLMDEYTSKKLFEKWSYDPAEKDYLSVRNSIIIDGGRQFIGHFKGSYIDIFNTEYNVVLSKIIEKAELDKLDPIKLKEWKEFYEAHKNDKKH